MPNSKNMRTQLATLLGAAAGARLDLPAIATRSMGAEHTLPKNTYSHKHKN